jgi:PleD family two-component response regulator
LDCCSAEEARLILQRLTEHQHPTIVALPMIQKTQMRSDPNKGIKFILKPVLLTQFINAISESIDFLQHPNLPEYYAEPLKGLASNPRGVSFPHIRILIVEDNIFNQTILLRILNKLQCKVETAGNGKEAVSLVMKNHYDLVFMDLQMPILGTISVVGDL